MQLGIYIIIGGLVASGAFLIRGRRNILSLRRRAFMQPEERIIEKAALYFKRIRFGAWLKARKGEKIDKEIYESISFLRNVIALGKGRGTGSDYIIEQLSHREGVLQPIYIRMLRFLRLGKLEEAVQAFSDEADTAIGIEFGELLLKWDVLDPLELAEILISYQKSIKEAKSTAQRKKDEMVSEFIYFPVVLNVFIIFINFIMVSYFMEQKYMFRIIL